MKRAFDMNVIETMESSGLVPVFYNGDAEIARNVMRACYKGGVRVFEFANRGPAAAEVFGALVETAADECPGMVLGIGSVVNAADCERFISAGARFVVSPILSPEVMAAAASAGIPSVPGCATPTEIYTAQRLGAEMVKVFPAAEVGGPSFVKAVLAPMPWSKIMVTGGVEPTRENLEGWFGAGARCVGMGSNLFPKASIAAGRWDDIAELCSEALEIIAGLAKR